MEWKLTWERCEGGMVQEIFDYYRRKEDISILLFHWT